MHQASSSRSVRRSISGMSATATGVSSPTGPPVISTTLACPGPTLPMRLTNPSGGPDRPPSRRRLIPGAPAVPYSSFTWARVMGTYRLEDLKQYSDTLRTWQGEALKLRFVEPRDTDELQHYFR